MKEKAVTLREKLQGKNDALNGLTKANIVQSIICLFINYSNFKLEIFFL